MRSWSSSGIKGCSCPWSWSPKPSCPRWSSPPKTGNRGTARQRRVEADGFTGVPTRDGSPRWRWIRDRWSSSWCRQWRRSSAPGPGSDQQPSIPGGPSKTHRDANISSFSSRRKYEGQSFPFLLLKKRQWWSVTVNFAFVTQFLSQNPNKKVRNTNSWCVAGYHLLFVDEKPLEIVKHDGRSVGFVGVAAQWQNTTKS